MLFQPISQCPYFVFFNNLSYVDYAHAMHSWESTKGECQRIGFILIAAVQSEIKQIRFDGNQSVAIDIPNRKEIMRFIQYPFAQV